MTAQLAGNTHTATPRVVLDVGCGSGSSTRAAVSALHRHSLPARILGLDASTGMLAQARTKPWPANVSFRHAPAEQLTTAASEEGVTAVDGIIAAYLFRNVADRDTVARQMFRLLRPGGVLVVQEYSVADSRRARWVWTGVCKGLILPLSTALRGNPVLYRYLWRSVVDFDSLQMFRQRLTDAGFADLESWAAPGWQRGILHTISARRPRAD